MTLKSFSAMPTHVTNICAKFHSNISTKYRNIVSCGTGRVSYLIYVSMQYYVLTTSGNIV